jgi:hypothetical protein
MAVSLLANFLKQLLFWLGRIDLIPLRVARFRHDQDKFDMGKIFQRTAKATWNMAVGWIPLYMLSCNACTCGLKAPARIVCRLKYSTQFSTRVHTVIIHTFSS